ncbi:MAG: RdgB/HAM1 family non-canonical purine NTP pyrophosphatase [Thermomicrobiaceae bacterium]|nr:RdgB/HAM1 family non-canonical purine NTP pyrophosphatase [Thermomicrobiaceae bacterium]
MSAEVVIASNNPGKLEEIRHLLPDWIAARSAAEVGASLPEETGQTFAENALLKARAVASQTGRVALADDSGLEVDALGGEPGVHSARFAGEPRSDARNNALLLARLAGVPPERRTARFRSVVAIVTPDGRERLTEGTIEGRIVEEPRGGGGFGYDPLFQPLGLDRTMAELTLEEKNAISHRGQALRRAVDELTRLLTRSPDDADSVS